MRQRRVMVTVMDGVCKKQYGQFDWEFIYFFIKIRFPNGHDHSG